ncbi:xyloglucan galactosyltransferase [Asimina triloba]
MSRRLLANRAVHRDRMEKLGGHCRNRFCLVFSISFALWFLMFYFLHSPELTGSADDILPLPDDYSVLRLAQTESHPPLPVFRNLDVHPPVDDSPPPSHQVIETQHSTPVKRPPETPSIYARPSVEQLQLPRKRGRRPPAYRRPPAPPKVERQQTPVPPPVPKKAAAQTPKSDPCWGRYVYVHRLPRKFNDDMIKGCKYLSMWTDMCQFTSNAGLGPPLDNAVHVFATRGWFSTNQFSLEVIFHNRMKQYKCLTTNASEAAAVFVPFYAGLDVSRYLWGSTAAVRDSTSREVLKWLAAQPPWKAMGGRDHFMVAGRISWDFRRETFVDTDWGNQLLLLPEARNMTVLVIESSPWNSNDFGIPYPTYFHPSSDDQISKWQGRMRRMKRHWLFTFAGGPRPNLPRSVRNLIIAQIRDSKRGRLLECDIGQSKCHLPGTVMKMFQGSVFCLQPSGDSYTRRSTFDSMLAGCIPVFFHPGSAYVQYLWHLPRDYTRYSVFIPEGDIKSGKVSIERRLLSIPSKQVKAMRETVIRMIPRLIYADPRSRLERYEDAFDVAVEGVIERVERLRKEMKGEIPKVAFDEEETWKYEFTGKVGEHEWDPLFDRA